MGSYYLHSLCLASFTQNNCFEVHVVAYILVHPFHFWVVPCMYGPQIVFHSTVDGTSSFHSLQIQVLRMFCICFCLDSCIIVGHMYECVNFPRNCIVFWNCAISCSCQSCIRVLVDWHPQPYSVWSSLLKFFHSNKVYSGIFKIPFGGI